MAGVRERVRMLLPGSKKNKRQEMVMAETPFDVQYRLPTTVVRFSGTRTTTVATYEPPAEQKSTTVTAAAAIEVRADPRTIRTVRIPDVRQQHLTVSLALLEDGRLTSTDATMDPRANAGWGAALGNAVALGTAGMIVGGPLGAVVGAVVGGAGTLVAARTVEEVADRSLLPGDDVEDEGDAVPAEDLTAAAAAATGAFPPLPKPEEVDVERGYLGAETAEAEVLIAYRAGIGRLAREHALAALAEPAATVTDKLAALERAMLSAQRAAKRSEDLYAAWLAKKTTTTKVVVDEQLYVDQLPTQAVLLREADERSAEHDDVEAWWPIVQQLQLMVTCDFVEPTTTPAPNPPPVDTTRIAHRPPQAAILRTWNVRPDPDNAGRWLDPELVSTTYGLVSHLGFEQLIAVPLVGSDKATVTVGFSATGALTSVKSDVSGAAGERVAALAGLPASLGTAVTTGSSLGNAFSPSAAELARLKQQVDIADARGKLTPASPDALADQRKAVEAAELAARLALANQLVQDPSHAVVVVQSPASG